MPTDANFPPTFDGLYRLAAHLRSPDGCPWDREQTPDTLKHLFLEECYELVEAIESGDAEKVTEELGDVLFHAALQIVIAREGDAFSGPFSGEDVFGSVIAKLERRHPHVFGDARVDSAEQAIPRWDEIKRAEMAGTDRSILDGVPKAMPALAYAQAVQGRAARMGFDWDEYAGVPERIAEELREMVEATEPAEREAEFGDALFSMVNASRWLGIEAETALRGSNRKFYTRFKHMERLARERGLDFESLPMPEKDALWEEVKALEPGIVG